MVVNDGKASRPCYNCSLKHRNSKRVYREFIVFVQGKRGVSPLGFVRPGFVFVAAVVIRPEGQEILHLSM